MIENVKDLMKIMYQFSHKVKLAICIFIEDILYSYLDRLLPLFNDMSYITK